MIMSIKGTNLLKLIEEFRAYPYDDQTGDDTEVWEPGATIGYGHLISKAEWPNFCGRRISTFEADRIFAKDLFPFELCVKDAIESSFKLFKNEYDALVMLAFNIGRSGFASSSVVKLINDEHAETSYDSLEQAWMAWNKSQGKVMRGLINRRNAEWQIYSNGIYERW